MFFRSVNLYITVKALKKFLTFSQLLCVILFQKHVFSSTLIEDDFFFIIVLSTFNVLTVSVELKGYAS